MKRLFLSIMFICSAASVFGMRDKGDKAEKEQGKRNLEVLGDFNSQYYLNQLMGSGTFRDKQKQLRKVERRQKRKMEEQKKLLLEKEREEGLHS